MEEKAFSGKQEEVFDLSEIVEEGAQEPLEAAQPEPEAASADEELIELTEAVRDHDAADGPEEHDLPEIAVLDEEVEGDAVVELQPHEIDEAPLTMPGMEQPAPEVAGGLFPSSAETPEEESAELSRPVTDAAPRPDEEAFLSLAAELEARLNELAEKRAEDARLIAERVTEVEQRFADTVAALEERERALSAENTVLREELASVGRLLSDASASAEAQAEAFRAELAASEARLAEAERHAEELAQKLAGLEERQAEAPAACLADAAFMAGLADAVSRAVEERLELVRPAAEDVAEVLDDPAEAEEAPSASELPEDCAAENAEESASTEEVQEAEEGVPAENVPQEPVSDVEKAAEEAPAGENGPAEAENIEIFGENAASQVDEGLSSLINEIAGHVGELEERMAEWELRCEQEAALAASRVIREEIAALKAEAALSGH